MGSRRKFEHEVSTVGRLLTNFSCINQTFSLYEMMKFDDTTIQGFRCIETKFSEKCQHMSHTLFFKEHSVRNSHESKPVGRTLFVLNVPPYYTQDSLIRIFCEAGTVFKVFFQDKPSSGQQEKPVKTGVEKWVKDYESQFVDSKSLQTAVDDFMRGFDKAKEKEEKKLKAKEGVADDEGWITVTRDSRNAGVVRTENMEQKVMANEKKKQTEKKLINFYGFQLRESKMEHLTQLRQKFEEDKRRIAAMKASRRFKPY